MFQFTIIYLALDLLSCWFLWLLAYWVVSLQGHCFADWFASSLLLSFWSKCLLICRVFLIHLAADLLSVWCTWLLNLICWHNTSSIYIDVLRSMTIWGRLSTPFAWDMGWHLGTKVTCAFCPSVKMYSYYLRCRTLHSERMISLVACLRQVHAGPVVGSMWFVDFRCCLCLLSKIFGQLQLFVVHLYCFCLKTLFSLQ